MHRAILRLLLLNNLEFDVIHVLSQPLGSELVVPVDHQLDNLISTVEHIGTLVDVLKRQHTSLGS
jgi:hypothetical protein